jgi:hypothetical protein
VSQSVNHALKHSDNRRLGIYRREKKIELLIAPQNLSLKIADRSAQGGVLWSIAVIEANENIIMARVLVQ